MLSKPVPPKNRLLLALVSLLLAILARALITKNRLENIQNSEENYDENYDLCVADDGVEC